MAKNTEGVYGLLDKLTEAYTPTAKKEVADVQAYALKVEAKPIEIQPWDWSFYADKLKDERFKLNDEMLRPYFELEQVKKGVFGLATNLYGLQFVKNPDIPVYHPEVEALTCWTKTVNSWPSSIPTSPSSGKQSGAWMTEFKGQWIKDGVDSRPHVSLVMNSPDDRNETRSAHLRRG